MRILVSALVVALLSSNVASATAPSPKSLDAKPSKEILVPSLSDQLGEYEASINNLMAQLIASPIEQRTEIFSEHSTELIEAISNIYSELQAEPSLHEAQIAKAERLLSSFEDKNIKRYLLSSEDYALWLTTQV